MVITVASLTGGKGSVTHTSRAVPTSAVWVRNYSLLVAAMCRSSSLSFTMLLPAGGEVVSPPAHPRVGPVLY